MGILPVTGSASCAKAGTEATLAQPARNDLRLNMCVLR